MKTTLSKEDNIIILEARHATQELFNFSNKLTATNTMGEGIVAAYAAIDDVLWHQSAFFDPDVDYENTEFWRILESDTNLDEKAEILL